MSGSAKKITLDTMDHVAVSVANVAETVNWYKQHFQCQVAYQDDTWALVEFANIRLAFVLPSQHPDHFAVLGDPSVFGDEFPPMRQAMSQSIASFARRAA